MDDAQEGSANAQEDELNPPDLNRRTFLGALGAAVAAGAFLGRGRELQGQQPTYWFYDSFGNVVPADPSVIAGGVYPPPLPEGVTPPVGSEMAPTSHCPNTFVSGGAFKQPNILLIMVDQMRFPRWLTTSQQSTFITSIMPNLYSPGNGLIKKSCNFPNYFVAANSCTPARSTILTGLYPQQTCMFSTQVADANPSLQPWNGGSGFPTIGDVLSQSLNINCTGSGGMSHAYDTAWIGKWHVSDFDFAGTGANGPEDYGFSSPFNIPNNTGLSNPYPNNTIAYPSPNGTQNEGAGGDTLGNSISPWLPSFIYNTLATPADPVDVNDGTLNIHAYAPPFYQLSDAAIYHAFKQYWLPAHPNTAGPWFLGLSFVNPHDIAAFPWAFGLASSGYGCGSGDPFNCAVNGDNGGYYPGPALGWQDTYDTAELINFAALPYNFYNAYGTLSTGLPPPDWNNGDDPESLPYKTAGVPGGKPGLQAYFENNIDGSHGKINTPEGWCIFLNYYYWLHSFVDTLIGEVLGHVNSQFSSDPPVIIFTSDHGDFGGSHNLHSKGGALYDEAFNVPLLIHYQGQHNAFTPTFACSSVDILPFIYTAALGNESWRYASGDIVNYLQSRESIFDFMFNSTTATQRRVAVVPNAAGGMQSLPYVLFSTDEYPNPTMWNNTAVVQPGHAIAFRTVDSSYRVQGSNGTANFYGGGKLGMYSYWDPFSTYPNTGVPAQFEFYDYYTNNYGETGNDAFQSGSWNAATAGAYLNAYNNIMAAELYNIYSQVSAGYNAALAAWNSHASQTWPPNKMPPP